MKFFGVHAEIAARERDIRAKRWDEAEARDRRLVDWIRRKRKEARHGV